MSITSFKIFEGTPDEKTVTPEMVENLFNHFCDAYDELQVYQSIIPLKGGDGI